MDAHLQTKINDVVEALKAELYHQTSCWSTIRTPSELLVVYLYPAANSAT
jgi:hypothetical protein